MNAVEELSVFGVKVEMNWPNNLAENPYSVRRYGLRSCCLLWNEWLFSAHYLTPDFGVKAPHTLNGYC